VSTPEKCAMPYAYDMGDNHAISMIGNNNYLVYVPQHVCAFGSLLFHSCLDDMI
jgi:hypothetical protein